MCKKVSFPPGFTFSSPFHASECHAMWPRHLYIYLGLVLRLCMYYMIRSTPDHGWWWWMVEKSHLIFMHQPNEKWRRWLGVNSIKTWSIILLQLSPKNLQGKYFEGQSCQFPFFSSLPHHLPHLQLSLLDGKKKFWFSRHPWSLRKSLFILSSNYHPLGKPAFVALSRNRRQQLRQRQKQQQLLKKTCCRKWRHLFQ